MQSYSWQSRLLILIVGTLSILLMVGCTAPQVVEPTDDGTTSPSRSEPLQNNPALAEEPALPVNGDDTATSSDDAQPDPNALNEQLGRIIGVVTLPDGSPAVDVPVVVVKGTAPYPEMVNFTDQSGTYSWTLPAGTFTLQVIKEGVAPLSQEVVVVGAEEISLDFHLQP